MRECEALLCQHSGRFIICQCFTAVAPWCCIVDWTVGFSAYLVSCGLRCFSNQISIFVGVRLISALATEPLSLLHTEHRLCVKLHNNNNNNTQPSHTEALSIVCG